MHSLQLQHMATSIVAQVRSYITPRLSTHSMLQVRLMQSISGYPGCSCSRALSAQRLWPSSVATRLHVAICSKLPLRGAHKQPQCTISQSCSNSLSITGHTLGTQQPAGLRKQHVTAARSGDPWGDFDRESDELLGNQDGNRRGSEPTGPSGRPQAGRDGGGQNQAGGRGSSQSQAGSYGGRQSTGTTSGRSQQMPAEYRQQRAEFSSRSEEAPWDGRRRQAGAQGQAGMSREGHEPRPSRGRGAPSGKTFPSRERDRSRAAKHDKKMERWKPDLGGKAQESVDWGEGYFGEKWTHKHGRLSDDFRLDDTPRRTPSTPLRHEGHASGHGRPHVFKPQHQGDQAGGRGGKVSFAETTAGSDMARPLSGEISFLGDAEESNRPAEEETSSSRGPVEATWRFYATCHPGMEAVVADELRGQNIGAVDIEPGRAGVTFWGDLETGYRANLWLRSAIRVLVLLAQGRLDPSCRGGDSVYEFFRGAVDWPELLRPGQRFALDARVRSCTDIPSALLVQQRGRDAICDAIRDARNEKPLPPDEHHSADLPLFAALFQDQVSLYRDMSGNSLHRRGYRSAMHKASLNEAVAAGLLLQAGWPRLDQPDIVLADPMCGSGTFLIEAALMARGAPPGLLRTAWPFQRWPDYDRAAWERCCREAKQCIERFPTFRGRLLGNDVHEGALSLARRDAHAAGVADMIDFHANPCGEWKLNIPPGMVITNPPWGQRLMDEGDESSDRDDAAGGSWEAWDDKEPESSELETTWRSLGDFLKRECPNAEAYIFSGNKDVTRLLHMKADRRYPVTIGKTDCRLLKYRILPPKPAYAKLVDEGMSAQEYADKLAALRIERQAAAEAR